MKLHPIQRISDLQLSDPFSMLGIVEASMKEGLEDYIPRRKGFSTPVTGEHQIPLLREDLMPKNVYTPAFNLNERVFLGLINEGNAVPQE